MKVKDTDEEHIYFDHYDLDALHDILDIQHKITQYIKHRGDHNMFQLLIIIDDFANDPVFTRHYKMLHTLYIRGRHNYISTIAATQKFNALRPIIRVNATALFRI